MPRPRDTPDTASLEQAWHYLMVQLAFRNPAKVGQGQYTRKVLRQMMRTRSGRR